MYFGRPRTVLKVVDCVIVAQTFVSLALRESSAKLGRSESESGSVYHPVERARVKGNGAERVDTTSSRGRIMRMDTTGDNANNNFSVRSGKAIPGDTCRRLKAIQPSGIPMEKLAQTASDKNQVMDELLNQDQIPADYGTQMAAFDPHIDSRRLDVRLATCAGDASAAPAARVMAVHLCGERRVKSAIPALEKICAAPGTPEILRRSAGCALSRIR